MKLNIILFYSILLLVGCVVLSSCTNEFEKARTSNDPPRILAKANEFYEEKEYANAQTLYELAIQYYRGKQEAEDLFFKYAYTYYYLGEYVSSSHYFKSFASTFYNSRNREEAAFMAAYSHYKLSPNYKLDQSFSLKAIEELQQFINTYPDSERITECNSLIDEMRAKLEKKSFAQGELYYNIGQYQSAVNSFQNLLKDFPGSPKEEETRYLLIKSSYILAENSVIDKQEERYQETQKLILKHQDKIKNRDFSKEIKKILNDTYKILKNKA